MFQIYILDQKVQGKGTNATYILKVFSKCND